MAFSHVKPCGARTRSGAPCRQPSMRETGKCKMHGGRTPRGLRSANTRTGRYSKSFPTRLQERFEAAMSDRELLALRKDISLIDAMIISKLAELRDVELEADSESIPDLVRHLADAFATEDRAASERALERLRAEIGRRRAEEASYREILALIRQKADLVTRENRRMADLDQHMTVEEGILLVRTLIGSLRHAVQGCPEGDAILKMVATDYRAAISVREV